MTEFIDFLNKQMVPIIALIITIIALFKGWVKPRQAIFDQREKLSKHSYEMYKISNDESLKNLALEYGYAAITKDDFLSLEQRKALVNSKDPVKDIDVFSSCRYLLNIKINPLSFEWKLKRYNRKVYLNFARTCRVLLYGLGCFIFTLPITYDRFFPSMIIEMETVPSIAKGWLVICCILVGGWIAGLNLLSGRRLTQAKNLIERHNLENE
ncbi:hypothetical protein J1779_21275 [Rahnella sp. FC061912-K]|uniref:hypothetical protein n=1 Tax=Rahnella rivi TaxID=2816249 RepID=UPI001C262736|nr:hypothetical protein [Rahnella rivi]MBU9832458.1 hypothetical protein [Rahnella rivi]